VHRVVFGPAARVETIEASDWYAARSLALAGRFEAAVDVAVARMSDNPLQFPVVFKSLRRVKLRRFPYALFFHVQGDEVHVIACFHASRDPRKWQRRR
jgi:plasmid stabilization system protein ParE